MSLKQLRPDGPIFRKSFNFDGNDFSAKKSTRSNYIIIYLLVASGIQCNSTTMNSRGTSPGNYLISVYVCSCFKAASLPTAVLAVTLSRSYLNVLDPRSWFLPAANKVAER